jgi:uncharacterized 2Fe-2S/4Fe-4S cluster protein (DUF4445 family)
VHVDGSLAEKADGALAGLAVDVGTTTLVVEAVDLESGRSLGRVARLNPQIEHGNDVISRIAYAMTHPEGAAVLQREVIGAVNACVDELRLEPETIYEAVFVGNSAMVSAAAKRDLTSLGVIPFEPVSKAAEYFPARAIGLKANSAGRAYFAPLIGGHAGADCLADIIACPYRKAHPAKMTEAAVWSGRLAPVRPSQSRPHDGRCPPDCPEETQHGRASKPEDHSLASCRVGLQRHAARVYR